MVSAFHHVLTWGLLWVVTHDKQGGAGHDSVYISNPSIWRAVETSVGYIELAKSQKMGPGEMAQ